MLDDLEQARGVGAAAQPRAEPGGGVGEVDAAVAGHIEVVGVRDRCAVGFRGQRTVTRRSGVIRSRPRIASATMRVPLASKWNPSGAPFVSAYVSAPEPSGRNLRIRPSRVDV